MLEPLTVLATRWSLRFEGPGGVLDPVVLRGALLLQYRRMVCPRSRWNDPCAPCPLLAECSYGQVFAARPTSMPTLTRNAALPRPWIFHPDPDDPAAFRLVLVGSAAALLPRIVRIFERLGPRGLRREDPPFRILKIEHLLPGETRPLDPAAPPDPLPLDLWTQPGLGPDLLLHFLTPTSISAGGRPVDRPEPGPVIRRMRDRVSTLAAAWCGGPPHWDFKRLGELAGAVRLEADATRWVRRRRVSGRTRESYSISGFVGEALWRGIPQELLPIVSTCRLLGVGKRCAFGNGAYDLHPAPTGAPRKAPDGRAGG